jgi:hypothetical protein
MKCLLFILLFSSIPAFADPQLDNQFSEQCYAENKSIIPGASDYWLRLCQKIQTKFELNCVRFSSPAWRDACPGINSDMKFECALIVDSVPGISRKESIAACQQIKSEEELACLSRMISSPLVWYPLAPNDVIACIKDLP